MLLLSESVKYMHSSSRYKILHSFCLQLFDGILKPFITLPARHVSVVSMTAQFAIHWCHDELWSGSVFWSESGAQCLTCCRVHVQDATEHSGESGAAGQLGTRPRATLKLWSENQQEKTQCVFSNIETSYSFQDCPWPSPCVTGVCVGAGLHYTVHRSHTIHPQYSYTAHTRPVSSEHGEGNWKLVNTLVLQPMQGSS